MADRYWVGGTGTWNSSNTANWSATSGGASGASVPTSADNVLFDDNSAAGNFTVTISGAVNCLTFDGLSGGSKILTIIGDTSSSLNVYGSALRTTTSASTSFSSFNGLANLYGNICTVSGNTQIKNIIAKQNSSIRLNYSVNTVTELLDLESGSSVEIRNNYTCNTVRVRFISPFTRPTINLGWISNQSVLLTVKVEISGYISITSFWPSTAYVVANPSGTTVNLNLGDSVSGVPLETTVHNLLLQPNVSTNTFRFDKFFNVTTLSNASSPCVIEFSPSANGMTFGTFDINGTVSTKTKIQSTVSGVRARITGPSSVVTNYVEVKDMQPSPDNSWISYNSTNAGNNFQWYFDNFNKPTSNLFFGSHV